MIPLLVAPSALLCLLATQVPPPGSDWIVPAGSNFVFDTVNGPVDVRNVIVQPGATLRVYGAQPFRLRATRLIQIDGTLDVSGFAAPDVQCLNCADLQSPPGLGGPGGGRGGIGNVLTSQENPVGGDATDAQGNPAAGGLGGETGWKFGGDETRRPGGGGGGALAAALALLNPDPNHVSNLGRAVRSGFTGSPTAFGALTGLQPPAGGAAGALAFVDADPLNDFWGRKLDPGTGTIVLGELVQPLSGRGGGGGGNSAICFTYPPVPWSSSGDEKGAGGGGGGGLGILSGLLIRVGPNGKIRCEGGKGGSGENSLAGGITRIGGGGGGGSGGMLILQARSIDLSQAGADAIRALGGAGGHGQNDHLNATCAGGSGGPGVIQLHVPPNGTSLLLPLGVPLSTLTVPTAHVLLPEPLP